MESGILPLQGTSLHYLVHAHDFDAYTAHFLHQLCEVEHNNSYLIWIWKGMTVHTSERDLCGHCPGHLREDTVLSSSGKPGYYSYH